VAVNRVVLIVLVLLGLAVAACGGVEQAGLGRSTLLVHQAAEGVGDGPAAAGLREAERTLGSCHTLTAAATYLGLAVVCVSGTGLYLQGRVTRRANAP
jgi:hypothetical protein